MSIDTMNVILPAYWASALINGDTSGLDDREERLLCEAVGYLAIDGWRVVDVARDENGEPLEPYFIWEYPDSGPVTSGPVTSGEVLDYVAHSITT